MISSLLFTGAFVAAFGGKTGLFRDGYSLVKIFCLVVRRTELKGLE